MPTPSHDQWKALGSIFSSPWFKRKWIIQEVATAQSVAVICGREEINWEDMGEAASFALLSSLEHLVDIDFCPCALLWSLRGFYQRGIRFPLLWLLNSFQGHQATDLRDHFYALIGLTLNEDSSDSSLQLNYHLSFVEVSILIVRMIITETKRLDCFKGIHRDFETVEDDSVEGSHIGRLPSWVTDWSNDHGPPAISFTGIGGMPRFSASRNTKHIAQFPELPGHVTTRGMLVDSIVDLGRGFRKAHTPPMGKTPLFNFLRWKALARRHARSSYSNSRYFDKAFCLTLLAGIGITASKATRKDIRLVMEFLEYLKEWKASNASGAAEDDYEKPDSEDFLVTVLKLRETCKNRRLVITAKGRMGLASDAARVGDNIILMMGADMPYVTRVANRQAWNLVGHCYIHGIMEGEAFESKRCENIQLV